VICTFFLSPAPIFLPEEFRGQRSLAGYCPWCHRKLDMTEQLSHIHKKSHVHRVSDAIQPSHSLLSPSLPAPNPSQHQSLFPPSIRVFSNESTLRMRWPKYWSFSFSIIPSKEIPGLISLLVNDLQIPFGCNSNQRYQSCHIYRTHVVGMRQYIIHTE